MNSPSALIVKSTVLVCLAESRTEDSASQFPKRLFLATMSTIFQFDQQRRRKLTALLGILIFALFFATQSIHVHSSDGPTDASHCSICLAAHAPVTVLSLPK